MYQLEQKISPIQIIPFTDKSPILSINDMIKMNDNKIIFSAPSKNNDKLYIIIFNIFNNQHVKIRYYLIEIFALKFRKMKCKIFKRDYFLNIIKSNNLQYY